MMMITSLLLVAVVTLSALLAGAAVLHLLPRVGGETGARLSRALCRAPWLDLPVTWFTVMPLIVGPIVAGWVGLGGALVGQVACVITWCRLHELANRQHAGRDRPRIVWTLNRLVGRWRNHAALWVTAVVTPLFWLVRVAQILLYPLLSRLVGLPRYRHGEWINVSRQKFTGLVGHDLIWCLYCDWMTGVWSLGSEMLRNVESFWCPIRFLDAAKCANCRIDFPDVDGGWVRGDGTMADVVTVLEDRYGAAGARERRAHAWFGHPARLTIDGQPTDADAS